MRDLLSIGTNRRESMIGTGIGLGLAGYRLNPPGGPLPALDLWFSQSKSLTAFAGPTPSFSRASSGTYFDANGVLQSAGVNAARFNHVYNGTSWVSRGLLLEEQRSNISTYSEDFSNAAWTLSDATISANAIVAPDGNATADGLVENSSNIEHFIYQLPGPVVSSGSKYVISVFAKKGSRDWVILGSGSSSPFGSGAIAYFNLANGTVGTLGAAVSSATIADVGNGWYRCCIFLTAIATTNAFQAIGAANVDGTLAYQGNGSTSIYIWGCQLEAGSFPTSYIPTTTASVTRSADVCQITGSDFSGFWNGTEGSTAAEYDLIGVAGTGTFGMVFQVDDNTLNNRLVQIGYEAGTTPNNAAGIFVANGGVAQANMYQSSIGTNLTGKASFAYKANDFALSVNGASVSTDTSGSIPAVTQMNIGKRISDGYLNGHIARLRYYRTRLENGTLRVLST